MDNQTRMNSPSRGSRIHPLYAAAAVGVILLSATGIAALTGVLPGTGAHAPATPPAMTTLAAPAPAPAVVQPGAPAPASTSLAAASPAIAPVAPAPAEQVPGAPAPVAATASVAPAAPAPAVQPPVRHHRAAPRTQVAQRDESGADNRRVREERSQAAVDPYAGRIVAITPVQAPVAHTSGVGAVGGAVVGGLLGNQVGHGNGRALATIAGALGGGLAGNGIEGKVRKSTEYQVRVRLDDGSYRTFRYGTAPALDVGQRVHIDRSTGALDAG